MSIMEASGLISWIIANPEASTALATVGLVIVTSALVVVGGVIGWCQVRVVSRGINRMAEASDKRDNRHKDTMEAEARRHTEAANRHTEAMDTLAAERTASEHRHEQAMKALDALIRNTAPGPASA